MKEFDPDNPLSRREMAEVDDGGAGLGIAGLLVGLAIALVMGVLFWNMDDRSATAAMNARPGVTTGSAPSAPPPPPDKDDLRISR